MSFNQTINNIKPSASMEVSKLAKKMKSQGENIAMLGIGDNHFDVPNSIQKKLIEGLQNGQTHYSQAQGLLELRELIANKYDNIYEASEIIVTPGVKSGLFQVLSVLGAERIVVVEPAWLGYEAICGLLNIETIAINSNENNWIEQLKQVDFDTIILCTPNNPNGNVISESDLNKLVGLSKSKKAHLLLDCIYEQFDFSGDFKVKHILDEPNVIYFNGFSKSHAFTGMRVGYLASKNQSLLKNVLKSQQNTLTCPSTLAQYGLVEFQNAQAEVENFKSYYSKNKDLVKTIIPEFEKYEPDAGFYYFVDLKDFGVKDAQQFCKTSIEEYGVALVPGEAYGKPFKSWVRLSFSVDREELESGLHRLKEMLDKLK